MSLQSVLQLFASVFTVVDSVYSVTPCLERSQAALHIPFSSSQNCLSSVRLHGDCEWTGISKSTHSQLDLCLDSDFFTSQHQHCIVLGVIVLLENKCSLMLQFIFWLHQTSLKDFPIFMPLFYSLTFTNLLVWRLFYNKLKRPVASHKQICRWTFTFNYDLVDKICFPWCLTEGQTSFSTVETF